MLFYALISAIRQSIAPLKAKKASSVTLSLRKKSSNYLEPDFVPNVAIFEAIMQYLSIEDSIKLFTICQEWSASAVEAFYMSPPFRIELQELVSRENTYYPYQLLVRELVVTSTQAEELLMGDLEEIIKRCTNLVSIRLESYWNLSNLLPNIIEENIPFLSRLELPGCQIGDAFLIKLIRKVFSLRYIDVSYTNVTLSTLPVVIRECLYLDTLDMSGSGASVKEMVADYEASEYYLVGDTLKKFKSSLVQLSLRNSGVQDDMITYVAKHCPNLERINLNRCFDITDTAVNSIAMHCGEIQRLDLGFCNKLTDIGIQSLAVHFSTHAELKYKLNNFRETEKSRRRFYSMSSFEKRQDVDYKSFQEFKPVVKTHTKVQLELIDLTNMTFLSHSSVCLLASKCPNLKWIILDGCNNVIDWYSPWSPSQPEPLAKAIVDDNESFHSAMTSFKELRRLTLNRHQILERKSQLKTNRLSL